MTDSEVRERLITMIIDKVACSRDEILRCTDIEHDLGCTGDDHFEFMEAYAKEFNVDMTGFLWYFHTHDESMATWSISWGNPPSMQVKRIPVDLDTLTRMAMQGKWVMDYPPHTLQPRHTKAERILMILIGATIVFFMVRSFLK